MQLIKGRFKNKHGQTINLRGISLGANALLPSRPFIPSDARSSFFTVKNLSFLSRPLELRQADEHLKRLKHWGFNLIRLVVTWEALEHQKPGDFDQAYIDYLRQLIHKISDYGFWVIIDAHQDVWSRYSGGAGAPRWTFESIGLAPRQFGDTDSAVLHHVEGDLLQDGAWVTNYKKFAAATMFTLFFGGRDFAPNTKVQGINPQEWLQQHYIEAFGQLADHLAGCKNILAFEAMNTPSLGWIGCQNLGQVNGHYHKGKMPNPFESMVLASGFPLEVEYWQEGKFSPKQKQKTEANPRGVKAWQNGFHCIWKTHGIWDIDEANQPKLYKSDYFQSIQGKKVNLFYDYYLPFLHRFSQRIRQSNPNTALFFDLPEQININDVNPQDLPENSAFTPQWLDYQTLYQKQSPSWMWWDFEANKIRVGEKSRYKKFEQQLTKLKKDSQHIQTNTLISKIAIPYDLNKGKDAVRKYYANHNKLWDFYISLLEKQQLDFIIWNYNPDNLIGEGDFWNREDHSIFSRDHSHTQNTLDSGGRALEAIVRPYAFATSGKILKLTFNYQTGLFEYEFEHEDQVEVPTLLFIPQLHYPKGCKVEVSDGDYELDLSKQVLKYYHSVERYQHRIRLKPL